MLEREHKGGPSYSIARGGIRGRERTEERRKKKEEAYIHTHVIIYIRIIL
jgi:hypothetical protein